MSCLKIVFSNSSLTFSPTGADRFDREDEKWLETELIVKTLSFSGKITDSIYVDDFKAFEVSLKKLLSNELQEATLSCIEEFLEIRVKKLDSLGNFKVFTKVRSDDSELSFYSTTDQISLFQLIDNIDRFVS